MKTAIELSKDGKTKTVFHRNRTKAWEHPYDDPFMVTTRRGGKTVSTVAKAPCPVCERGRR